MEITWCGHSSFLVEDTHGRKLLTDPFNEDVGYNIFSGKVDAVTISHHHFDHDYTEKLEGKPETIDKVGMFYAHDIPIKGIPSYHDKVHGAKRGENIIFVFEMDGYKLCHLGDLGHLLTEDDIKNIGEVDILFIPVGGNFTIDAKEASKVAALINSHIVIPMHYKTRATSLPIDGVDPFLTIMKTGENVGGPKLTLQGQLQGHNVVKILDYVK